MRDRKGLADDDDDRDPYPPSEGDTMTERVRVRNRSSAPILAGVILAMIVGILIFAFTSSQRQKGPKKVIAVPKRPIRGRFLAVGKVWHGGSRTRILDVDFRAPASESDIEGKSA